MLVFFWYPDLKSRKELWEQIVEQFKLPFTIADVQLTEMLKKISLSLAKSIIHKKDKVWKDRSPFKLFSQWFRSNQYKPHPVRGLYPANPVL
jgi:hypothetical protein